MKRNESLSALNLIALLRFFTPEQSDEEIQSVLEKALELYYQTHAMK
ncbi:hypothetical protein [Anaerotruncus colihominis]|nr:hypothetical protein [Anaerotruncus colihominis]